MHNFNDLILADKKNWPLRAFSILFQEKIGKSQCFSLASAFGWVVFDSRHLNSRGMYNTSVTEIRKAWMNTTSTLFNIYLHMDLILWESICIAQKQILWEKWGGWNFDFITVTFIPVRYA